MGCLGGIYWLFGRHEFDLYSNGNSYLVSMPLAMASAKLIEDYCESSDIFSAFG